MRPILLAAALSIYLSSCVTRYVTDVPGYKYDDIRIESTMGSNLVYDCDKFDMLVMGDSQKYTITCGEYPLSYDENNIVITERSPKLVPITIKNSGAEQTFYIKPHRSVQYYLNVFTLGYGFKKDRANPNSYSYPRKVALDVRDKDGSYTYYKKPRQSDWQVVMAPPLFNGYGFSFGKQVKGTTAITATHAGVNYWYNKRSYLSLEGGLGSASRFCPDGCRWIDSVYADTSQRQSMWFVSLRSSHYLNRFDIGYGAYIGKHKWKKEEYVIDTKQTNILNEINDLSIGPVVSSHFQILSALYFGFEYQPQLFSIDKRQKFSFNYQHVINVGFQLRLVMKRHW